MWLRILISPGPACTVANDTGNLQFAAPGQVPAFLKHERFFQSYTTQYRGSALRPSFCSTSFNLSFVLPRLARRASRRTVWQLPGLDSGRQRPAVTQEGALWAAKTLPLIRSHAGWQRHQSFGGSIAKAGSIGNGQPSVFPLNGRVRIHFGTPTRSSASAHRYWCQSIDVEQAASTFPSQDAFCCGIVVRTPGEEANPRCWTSVDNASAAQMKQRAVRTRLSVPARGAGIARKQHRVPHCQSSPSADFSDQH